MVSRRFHPVDAFRLVESAALVSVLGLFSCRSTPIASDGDASAAPPGDAPTEMTSAAVTASMPSAPAPMDLEGTDSLWAYLSAKYDSNGDGKIHPDEYDREAGQFENVDRNRDGVLDASDYVSAPEMDEMLARALVFLYFQEDDLPSELSLEELMWSFSIYDEDLNDAVTRGEFEALADERMRTDPDSPMGSMVGNVDPYAELLSAADGDRNGAISTGEMETYFKSNDDGDGIWTQESWSPSTSKERGEPQTGPRVGTLAPDFELCPPEGGEVVKLSSFKEKKPVALIFGSYT